MLKASGLVRSYGHFKAVDDVSFDIGEGQIVGLLGHNGAGKTTIMKMLSGYLEPDAGTILFDQKETSENLQGFQKQLGYLPENLPLYQDMLVADYLDYASDLKGLDTEEKRREMVRVIQETGIAEKILAPISTLSRGFKQRVGVAQAILGSPKLLILDEPTNGLDPSQTEQMRGLIREISKRATVILSTHIMQEVDALCERVLILKSGRLALDQSMQELRRSRELKIVTSLPLEKAEEFFKERPEIESWKNTGGDTYLLQVKSEVERRDLAGRLAADLTGQGESVFELTPVTRDLETVVREIGAVDAPVEVADAA